MITCATYSFGESSRAFAIDSLASTFSFKAPWAPARASQARGLWGYFATSCWPRASWPARSLSKPFRVIWIWSRSASDAPAAFCSASARLVLNSSSEFAVLATFRSEEHTSELQSRFDLVCRLLLEKKKLKGITQHQY